MLSIHNLPYEKVGKNEPVCIADEVPFEIPESWEWCRLGDLFQTVMGQSPSGESVADFGDGMEFHQGKICFGERYLKKIPASNNSSIEDSTCKYLLYCPIPFSLKYSTGILPEIVR